MKQTDAHAFGRLLALLAMLLVVVIVGMATRVAQADNRLKSFHVTLPTENTDGTAIAPGDLETIEMLCSGDDGGPYDSVLELPVIDTWQRTFPTGDWYCVSRVTNTEGVHSDYSNQVFFTVLPPVPNPPSMTVD